MANNTYENAKNIVITCKEIIAKPTTLEDALYIAEVTPQYTPQKIKKLCENNIKNWNSSPEEYHLSIFNRNNEWIGKGSLHFVDYTPNNRNALLSVVVAPKYRGLHYASDVINCVLNYGFEKLNLEFVEAHIKSNNIPSIKASKKCGFQEIYADEVSIKKERIEEERWIFLKCTKESFKNLYFHQDNKDNKSK